MSASVASKSPVAAHSAESEKARSFYQERIALLSKIALALSTFFLVGSNVIALAMQPRAIASVWSTPNGLHLLATLVPLAVWRLTCRADRALRHRALVVLDVVTTVLPLVAFAMMTALVPLYAEPSSRAEVVPRLDLVMLMITLLTLITRAMIIPSTLRHTLLVSLAGVIPTHVLAYWAFDHFASDHPAISTAFGVANTSLWSIAAIILACACSRIIYGLRAEVAAVRRLGQYVIGEKIGEGGMGTVYRASHALLRRPTAVKLLSPDRAGAASVSRFEREVQLTSRLTHPNTVAIFDYGHTADGLFYYAMEYLDGIDLDELVGRYGPQPPARVVHLLAQVCGSLSEAHAVGLVHRDIKPANIIVCERGGTPDVAKVVDFGLVKEIGATDAALTASDVVVGTPHFLAPEMIRGATDIDARTDLYALGAVGYFLLAGAPVFDGGLVEICAKHLHDPPPPLAGRARQPVPPALEALLLRCLAKAPEDRPASADALHAALASAGVPPWTKDDALGWWASHGGALRHESVIDRAAASCSPATTIEVRAALPR
jgi:serine/threonine-protein kinase